MKILNIESQAINTTTEASLLEMSLLLAKEAGYVLVRDHWGYNAYDEYGIDEAIEKFKVNNELNITSIPELKRDDLPF